VADPELWDAEGEPPPLKTYVSLERPRTILTRNDSPDVPFDVSLNAYRGCEHGCAYCFARPSHAYLGLSPGLDFETRLTAKLEAPRLLAEALAKPGYTPSPIAMGTNTDPYQPIEKRFGLTRAVLEVLDAHGHPCTITTKNHLVTRDLDVLERLAARDLVVVNLSVTTLDPALARALEPRASAPHRRLAAIRALAQAGVPVNVFVSPLIPALNDHELEAILEAAAKAGARGASSIPLRLPHEVKDLFVQWLRVNRPDRAERVLGHVRAMRGGGLNEPRFGARMRGEGPYAALMRRRFEAACTRLGLARDRFALATQLFRPPPQAQGDLFG
jgi:DNA repair photolyase